MPSKVNVNVPQTRYCIGKRNQASILGVWFAKTKVTTQIHQQPLENSIRIRLVSSALVHCKSINIKSIKSIDKSNTKCEEESIRIRWMGNLSFQNFLQEHMCWHNLKPLFQLNYITNRSSINHLSISKKQGHSHQNNNNISDQEASLSNHTHI